MWDLIVSVPYHCLSFYFKTTRKALLKPFCTDSETIKPYLRRNMQSLAIRLVILSFKGYHVSCIILILFRI